MAYVSINRAAIKPEAAPEFERIGAQWLHSERERLSRDELLSRQLVRADDGSEYFVISVWASREAHERNEDSPAEQEGLRQIAGLLAGQPEQFTGEVIVDASERAPAAVGSAAAARVSIFHGAPERLDEAIRRGREQTLPALERLAGFRGLYALVDRQSGKGIAVSLWENEAALRAADQSRRAIVADHEAAAQRAEQETGTYEVVIQP